MKKEVKTGSFISCFTFEFNSYKFYQIFTIPNIQLNYISFFYSSNMSFYPVQILNVLLEY